MKSKKGKKVKEKKLQACYSPNERSVMGKTVPEVLDITQDRRPKAVHKTEGTVFFQYGPTLAGE